MGLNATLLGLLIAIPSFSGSLLRIPFALWSDKVGSRKSLLILLITSIIGMFGLFVIISTSYHSNKINIDLYPLFILFGALAGCGIATSSSGISQTSYWYPANEQGKALGFYGGIGNLAPGIFLIIVPVALSIEGLGGSFLVWTILLILGTLIYYKIGQNAWYFQFRKKSIPEERALELAISKGQELFPNENIMANLKNSSKNIKTWILVGLYFTSFGGFIALAPWFPNYWLNYYSTGNINIVVATIAFGSFIAGIFVISSSIIRVYAGSIADKITGEKSTLIGAIILLLGSCCMTFSTISVLSIVALFIIALGMGIMNAAVYKLIPIYVPEAVGGAAGWIAGIGGFGGFVIPPILGFFVDIYGKAGYAYGFTIFDLLGLICLFLVFLLFKFNQNENKY